MFTKKKKKRTFVNVNFGMNDDIDRILVQTPAIDNFVFGIFLNYIKPFKAIRDF